MTLLTGSVKITIGLMLVLLVAMMAGNGYAGVADADGSTAHSWHEQRWILVLSFIAKIYVSDALASNIQYSGSYEN